MPKAENTDYRRRYQKVIILKGKLQKKNGMKSRFIRMFFDGKYDPV